MRNFIHRAIMFGVSGLVLVVLMTGCTLTGAPAAPLTTPVGGGTGLQPPTETPSQGALPEPVTPTQVNIYATLTAQAPTSGPTQDGGEMIPPGVTPTAGTPTPTIVPTEASSETCPPTHVVQPGENLYRIALKYGLTYKELAAANGITNPDMLPAGTVLKIPGCGGTGEGGTTGNITPQPGDTIDEETGDILHTVQPGENLYRIALKYGLTWQTLAAYNGIANPDAIYVGQVIRIPQNP